MAKIVECVPNISEGRNTQIIEAVMDRVRQVKGEDIVQLAQKEATEVYEAILGTF